jgi:hypothetical protein
MLSLLTVGVWRIWLELIRYLAGNHASWAAWDGGWYQSVINVGYKFIPEQQSNVAFFPLFPQLVKLIAKLTSFNVVAVGVVLNILVTVGTCWLVCKLVDYFRGQQNNLVKKVIALGLLLSFPTAFFFAAFYADAMVVGLTTGALYWSLKKMYKQGFALTALATAAKISTLAIIPVQIYLYWCDRRPSKKNIIKLISLTLLGLGGLACFALYLHFKVGNSLAFMETQNSWGKASGFFLMNLLKEYLDIYRNLFNPVVSRIGSLGRLFNSIIPFISIGSIYYFVKNKLYWLAIFIGASVLIPLASGSLTSLSRYILIFMPVLAAYVSTKLTPKTPRYRLLIIVYLLLAFSAQSLLCYYFVQQTAFIA